VNLTYLDTHVVVWLYEGRMKRLSQEARRSIERADTLLVSPMVELELNYLFRRGRVSSADVLRDLAGRIGLGVCDLPFSAVTNEALHIGWTEDVFDRLIVAQAMVRNSKLVSADEVILEKYSQAVW
jgi:PIN domain nuclease of toxin-antitoxin system